MRSPSASGGRRRLRPWIVGALVLAFDLLVLVHLHDRFWWPPDDGAYAHPAERMLHGEVLHRDVHEAHPAIHFLNEASLAVFGNRLVSLRYPLVAASFAQAVLVFLLLLPAGELVAAAGTIGTTAFGFVQYLNPQPSWYCAFLVAVAAALLRAPSSRSRNAALGLLAGLAAIVRQLTGAILVAALVTWLLAERDDADPESPIATHGMGTACRAHTATAQAKGSPLLARALAAAVALGIALYLLRSTTLLGFALFGVWPLALAALALRDARLGPRAVASRLLPFAAGGIAAALPLVAFHALHGSLGALYDDAVRQALVISRFPYLAWGSYGMALAAGWGDLRGHGSPALVANGLYWLLLPVLGALLGLLAVRRRLLGRPLHPLVHLAVFYGIISLLNQIPIYLYYTLTLTIPALLLALDSPHLRRIAAAVVLALSAIALRHHAAQPLARGLDGIWAGTRLAVVPIGIPKLAIWTNPEDAAVYRALLAHIEAATAPGEPIFAFPNDAEIYYLSGRRNPFAFFNTAVDIRTPEDAAAAVAGLARVRPKLALFVPDDKYRTPPLEPVVRFVRDRYRLEARIGRFEVYRLIETPAPSPVAAR